jgi:hypothetical protein
MDNKPPENTVNGLMVCKRRCLRQKICLAARTSVFAGDGAKGYYTPARPVELRR